MIQSYQRGKSTGKKLDLIVLDSNFSPISVHRMRDEFEAVLSRMSHEFAESPRRIAFLINNYDLIVSVFQVSFLF